MTRISNVDQVMLLLRQQLQRMSKSDRQQKTGNVSAATPQRREAAVGRIEEITRADELSEDDLARTLVSALLVDEFGEAVANDPKFQSLVGEVHRIIAADADGKALLQDALKDVKKRDSP
jgi:hypothetical protein